MIECKDEWYKFNFFEKVYVFSFNHATIQSCFSLIENLYDSTQSETDY